MKGAHCIFVAFSFIFALLFIVFPSFSNFSVLLTHVVFSHVLSCPQRLAVQFSVWRLHLAWARTLEAV